MFSGWVVCWMDTHLGGCDVVQGKVPGNCVVLLMGCVTGWPTGTGGLGKAQRQMDDTSVSS